MIFFYFILNKGNTITELRTILQTFPFKIIFSLGQFQYYTGPVWLNELDRWI
jgi:hypothetical protein